MNRIRCLREAKRLSQTTFAAQIGVTQQAVANWEAGVTDPTWAKAPLIADLLGCSIDTLYGREPPESAEVESAAS